MLVPTAPREPDLGRQRPFRLAGEIEQPRRGFLRKAGPFRRQCPVVIAGALFQPVDRVLQWREIEMWNGSQRGWLASRLGRVVRQTERIHRQHLRLCVRRVTSGVRQLLHLVDVAADGVGQIAVAHHRDVRVGHPQHDAPDRLRQCAGVHETRITEAAVVLIGVVGGMIDAADLAFAAVADIQRGEPQVLQERRIIGTRAQRADRQVARRIERDSAALAGLLVGAGQGGRGLHPRAQPRRHRHIRLRIGHVRRHGVDQMLQRMTPFGSQKAAAVAVGIDVNETFLFQLGFVRLRPFGRAHEHRFFRVPAEIDERPLRPPAVLHQRTDRLRLGHHRNVTAHRVAGAEHPTVVMVTAQDPLIRVLGALDRRDDVVDRFQAPLGSDHQMRARLAAADVIGNRQRAAPRRLRHGSVERGEKVLRIAM